MRLRGLQCTCQASGAFAEAMDSTPARNAQPPHHRWGPEAHPKGAHLQRGVDVARVAQVDQPRPPVNALQPTMSCVSGRTCRSRQCCHWSGREAAAADGTGHGACRGLRADATNSILLHQAGEPRPKRRGRRRGAHLTLVVGWVRPGLPAPPTRAWQTAAGALPSTCVLPEFQAADALQIGRRAAGSRAAAAGPLQQI